MRLCADGGAISPDTPNAVRIEHILVAYERNVLRLGLSDENTVEWVFVSAGKQACACGVVKRNGERLKSFSLQLAFDLKSDASPAALASLTSRTFVAISQADAALTSTVFRVRRYTGEGVRPKTVVHGQRHETIRLIATATGKDPVAGTPSYSGGSTACSNSAAGAGGLWPVAPAGLVAWAAVQLDAILAHSKFPPGRIRFCALMAVTTSVGERFCAYSALGFRSTMICRSRPPYGSVRPAPCTFASRVRRKFPP